VLPEMAVFPLFSLLFGVSLTVSLLCLYYLFKNWKQDPGHYVVTTFSSILTLFNIIAFVLKSMTTVKHLHVLVCGTEFLPTFQVGEFEASDKFSNVLVPAFLWVTDGFLLYRTWVVWFQRRNFIIIPALVYLASVVCGVAWMVRAVRREFGGVGFNNLDDAAVRWVPALGFSCGMDAIATTMIAGRLGYHHLWRRKLVSNSPSPYTSLLIICVESAVLSTLAKILHLTIPNLIFNPIVIPICVLASNLIVLRKALGMDVQRSLADMHLSALQFEIQDPNRSTQSSKASTSGVLDSYVVEGLSLPEHNDNFSSSTSHRDPGFKEHFM